MKTQSIFSKKIIWAIAVFTILLVIVVALGLTQHIKFPFFHKQDPGKAEQAAIDYNRKKAVIEQSNPTSSNPKTQPETKPYTPPSSPDSIKLSASQSGTNVVIVSKLIGYSDGTCNLTITNGAKTITKSARVIYQPDFSTCEGFTIPVSEAGTGNWVISLAVTTSSNTEKQTTSLEVQ